MSTKALNVVRKNLKTYSDRGVFKGLSEVKPRNGTQTFTFVWLGERPLELDLDTRASTLTFKRLLPNVPRHSQLYSDLKRLIESRRARDLPRHRRIELSRAEVGCVNRAGDVSIKLKIRNNQYAYGMNRLVNLVHEIFVHLNDSHPDYMCENFNVRQE